MSNIVIYCFTFKTCRNLYTMRLYNNNGIDFKEIKITAKQFKELKKIGVTAFTHENN